MAKGRAGLRSWHVCRQLAQVYRHDLRRGGGGPEEEEEKEEEVEESDRYDFTQFQGQRNIVNLRRSGCKEETAAATGSDGEGKRGRKSTEGEGGQRGPLSRAISTAHCATLVAHNSDPVQLGPFPTIQDYPLY